MAMKIEVGVFWEVASHSDVLRIQRFGGPFCLSLQGGDMIFTSLGTFPHM